MGVTEQEQRPVRLIVTDDLARRRVTVLFRIFLVIPAWLMFVFWGIAMFFVAIAAWFVLLARGRLSNGMHDFLSAYLRYSVQISAYLHLAAAPYPGFAPDPEYPVRVEVDGPLPQRRWKVFFRFFLAFPALLLAAASGGSVSFTGINRSTSYGSLTTGFGTAGTAAILGWFASLVRGRMPRGLRDLTTYSIGYSAQTAAYLLLLTDRYPSADPALAGPMALPEHAVELDFRDDLSRSRLVTLFRLLLALPHFLWFALWTIAGVPAAFLGWLTGLFLGRLPSFLHRFLAAYVRYSAHLSAFLYMVGGPFPGFVGAAGSYPVDILTARPTQQRRWSIGFRGLLFIPAFVIASAYGSLLLGVAILGWLSSLARGRMPAGLARIGAAAIRYQAQTWAYFFFVTGQYPYAAPTLEGEPEPVEQLSLLEPPEAATTV